MRRLLQHLLPLALGSALGFGVMALLPVALHAQGTKIHADPALSCAWSQPAASLATAQAMQVKATLDNAAAVTVAHTCTGVASPFDCHFPVSATMQVVGPHTLVVQGANVDPVDGSVSAFVTLVTVGYDIVPPLTPPSPGSNGRIIKIIGGLLLAGFITIFSFFGHH